MATCACRCASASLLDEAGWVSLEGFAVAVGKVTAVDADLQVVVIGDGAAARRDALESLEAPDVELPGIDGRTHHLSEWSGRKRAVAAWASWCGCRYELGAWQALQDELAPLGFTLVSISMDDDVEAARPWVEAASPAPDYPVLVDPDHRIAEAYGIVNVPSVVWIDEHDRVVRPPVIAPGDDQFVDFTLIDSKVHHDQLRSWVRDDQLPFDDEDSIRAQVDPPTEELQQARVERRLAAWLHRHGHDDRAAAHSSAPSTWRRWTSRSCVGRCRCRVRTRSASRSSRSGTAGRPPAAPATAQRGSPGLGRPASGHARRLRSVGAAQVCS